MRNFKKIMLGETVQTIPCAHAAARLPTDTHHSAENAHVAKCSDFLQNCCLNTAGHGADAAAQLLWEEGSGDCIFPLSLVQDTVLGVGKAWCLCDPL